MNLDTVLASLAEHPELSPHLQAVERIPARVGVFNPLPDGLPPRIVANLQRMGISELYAHQAEAIRAARKWRGVVLATGTSSGKSLGYLLPVLEHLEGEPAARALILYPTKALAQDQESKLEALTRGTKVRHAIYDGDTPASRRTTIRKASQIVLTNPDMLHLGILPRHEQWGHFLRSLRVIVLDEMHVYKGVFGSHVAWVLRRLLRLCEWYGSRPKVLAASATAGNPGSQFTQLVGFAPEVVDLDAGTQGPRAIAVLASADEGAVSPQQLVMGATDWLIHQDLRVMTFARSRGTVERLLVSARERNPSRADRFESYRAGYTPQERRTIEQRLFKGDLQALFTTNAMELGVDVGRLDSVVMHGLPTSRASFWQQAGRAGRGGSPGLVIAVAHEDPWEQYLVRRPEILLDRSVEAAYLAPENPLITESHLTCAAYERPVSDPEITRWGPEAQASAEAMAEAGQLHRQMDRYFFPSHTAPAEAVNLRGSRSETITLLSGGETLGTMERTRALREAFTGAIYLHRGQTFEVVALDLDAGIARCIPTTTDFFTLPLSQSLVVPNVELRAETWGEATAKLITATVTTQTTGFKRVSLRGHDVLDTEELELPPVTMTTMAVRADFPLSDPEMLPWAGIGLHGTEHALLATAPAMVSADRNDFGSMWLLLAPETATPALYVYDSAEGGSGLAQALFERRSEWADRSLDLLQTCGCDEGCPRCLLSSRCEWRNESLHKPTAMDWLRRLAT